MLALSIPLLFAFAWAAGPCGAKLDPPRGFKRIHRYIFESEGHRIDEGFELLQRSVEKTKPDRREVADHLAAMLADSEDVDRQLSGRALLTYLKRSPAIAPDYVESLTTALFAQFHEDQTRILDQDLERLEGDVAFYLEAAGRRPTVAAAHFEAHLDDEFSGRTSNLLESFRSTVKRTLVDWRELQTESDEDIDPFEYAAEQDKTFAMLIQMTEELGLPTEPGLPALARMQVFDEGHFESLYLVDRSFRDVELTELLFWMRLTERVARTLPRLSHHPVLELAELIKREFVPGPIAQRVAADEHEFERERVYQEVREWLAGRVKPGRESEHRRWLFYGRPEGSAYWNLLLDMREALREDNESADESEQDVRARLAERFPPDSLAHRHYSAFTGPTVHRVEQGTRDLPVPPALSSLVPELPAILRFDLAHHYDEHIWERAERRRFHPAFLSKRPPERVVDQFSRLVAEIQAQGAQVPRERLGRALPLPDATELLARIRDGLARTDFETTVWSIAKRNAMLEALNGADWRLLEGQASHPGNVLVQAEINGTRFNMAVCVREPCSGVLRRGGVASIYPVCGPGVFLVPRTSKISRTLNALRGSLLTANRDFRAGLVSAKACSK